MSMSMQSRTNFPRLHTRMTLPKCLAALYPEVLKPWSACHASRGTARLQAATDYSGILHFANAGECSWQEYGQWALDCCQTFGVSVKAKTVGALELKDMKNWVARRPVYSVLSSARYTELTGASPRAWRDAVADYIRRFYSKK